MLLERVVLACAEPSACAVLLCRAAASCEWYSWSSIAMMICRLLF